METRPEAPIFTTAMLARVSCGPQLRLEARGANPPFDGQSVRYEEPRASVIVALSTTAVALTGTPAMPPTVRLRVVPVPHGVVYPPVPSRESSTRIGGIVWNAAPPEPGAK